MYLRELPPEISELLKRNHAPQRLIAHLKLVHDMACRLVLGIEQAWPELVYDREAVLMGAGIHDIGKLSYPGELTGEGQVHEAAGEQLLLEQGWPERYARFARTHGQWQAERGVTLEDLLVALADKLWKGKRDTALEDALAHRISEVVGTETWEIYLQLDELASELSEGAHERIVWQGEHSLSPDL